MSVPIKDAVKINFAGGLDLKNDPKQIDASEFLALNNMVFTTGGQLTKRNGFAGGFTKTVLSPNPALTFSAVPGTLAAARKVFSYNDELLLNDAWNLYSWDASASSWIYKGRSTTVSVATQAIAQGPQTYTVASVSIDITSGIKVFAYEDFVNARVIYSIQDTVTGQFIINQAQLGGVDATYSLPKCISISGKSWIVARNVAGGIDYQLIVGQTVTGGMTTFISNLNLTHQFFDIDVDVFSGNIYIAYLNSSGTPAVTISALSTSLVVGNTITKNATATNGVSWFGDGTNIWVIYNTGTVTSAFIVNNAVSATVAAPTIIDNIDSTGVNNLTGCWSTTQSKAFIFYDPLTLSSGLTATAAIYFSSATLSGSTITPSAPALFMGSVSLNSKAFTVSGIPHVIGLYGYFSTITQIYNGSSSNLKTVPQATNFLLNLYNVTPSMGTSDFEDVIANIAAKISPDEAAGVPPQGAIGGSANASSGLSGIHQNSSGAWDVALLQNTNYGLESITEVDPFILPTGVIDCQFNFSLTNPDTQALGNNALIAGGQVSMYDGANVVEQNFHIYPNSINQSSGIANLGGVMGSGVADTLYGYIFTYEWIDNQGQVHRSFPSPVMTPLASGHLYTFASGTNTGEVTLTIPTLRVTNKSGTQVFINVYRTVANGSVYYLVGAFGTKLNNPAANTVTYIDGAGDDTIIGNIQLYTTGALGYYAPPATSALTNFKNRAMQISSEDPFQVGYSNAVLQNFPVQFVPEFLQNIGTVGGALTTIAQMDDKLILFKSGKINGPAIYYMQGQGPAPSGANNDFQDPLPIAVDAGCVDRPSVVLTPVGLMFKSDKGIYLLDRGLQASYIGAPVESYNQYSVLSAQLIPNSTQVRFWLSNGTLLMYDYFFKKWASWSPPAGISDCIFQGQHTYVTSAGQVYQETPGLFIDDTNIPILMSFTTAWIKLAGLQGYQRAYFFYLLAQYISAHKLSLSLFTDFSATPDSIVTITPNTVDTLENWRIFFAKQRCQAFQIQLTEVYTGTLGQGFNMSGLNLIAGVKSKFRTISAAQSIG